jgi:Surface lipoprotein assembly modifier
MSTDSLMKRLNHGEYSNNKMHPAWPLARFVLALAWLCGSLLLSAGTSAGEIEQKQFTEALQAINEDRLKTASALLDGILSSNPNMHRARLELARTQYLSMNYEDARRQAQRVLDDPNTPESVRITVLAFIAQIDADEKKFSVRHQWTPSIYLGTMYDNNVNVGPDQNLINIGGTLFPIGDQKSDLAAVINPGITHTYNPDKHFDWGEHNGFLLWQSSLNGYYRHYRDEHDFDLGVLTARTGPAWVVPRHWRASINLQADQIWLGGGRLAFFTSLNPTITWQIGNTTEFGLEGVLTRRSYNKDLDSVREGWYKWIGATLGQYLFENKLAIKGGAGYFWFDTDDSAERFAYTGPDVFLGMVVQAWDHGSVFARASYRNYQFLGFEPGFPDRRDENEFRYTVGFQHSIASGALSDWALMGNWTHSKNDSNVPLYDYDRDQFSLGLSRNF